MIIISSLKSKKNLKDSVFSDINLDFSLTQASNNRKNNDVVMGNDVVIAIDERAILNSIENILTQKRYLEPSFNANLSSFIGQPISNMAAKILGDSIEKQIALYEPRVNIENIFISPNVDKQIYNITIILTIPSLNNTQVKLNSSFNNSGNFIFYYK